MSITEHTEAQSFFIASRNVWFPDFMEELENAQRRYTRCPERFGGMAELPAYFRAEYSREQFIKRFLSYAQPQKMLQRDRKQYLHVMKLCTAYQEQNFDAVQFDEQLLLAFRSRPEEDVFSPVFEDWEDITALISVLTQKQSGLPVHFDGIGLKTYLAGKITRSGYVESYMAVGVCDHLAQLQSYGRDKEEFSRKYAMEISVCMQLQTVCLEYRDGKRSPVSFDAAICGLAKEFCTENYYSIQQK